MDRTWRFRAPLIVGATVALVMGLVPGSAYAVQGRGTGEAHVKVIVDFAQQPLRFPHLPNPGGSSATALLQECAALPAPAVPKHQTLPKQEPGTRPRRPAPR